MYKVFIYDKPVLVGTSPNFRQKNYQHFDDIHLKSFLEALQSSNVEGITVSGNKDTWQAFLENFIFIEAAGGVVKNENDEILLIHRLGKWDLPKGKREKGEDIPTCAMREVEEECAVDGLKIIQELDSTYHCYPYKGQWALKKTYWFLMETAYKNKLVPQTEEGIEKVIWGKPTDVQNALKNTYASIVDVLGQYSITIQ